MHTREPLDRHEGLLTDFVGHEVLDEHGLHIGTVTDLVDSPQDGHAEFLVVDPGLLRPAHYVPVAGSYHTSDGRVVVPWDKHWVKTAPRATGDHVPTQRDQQELLRHYTAS
jgi:sporulation protein YlmC with PRC-barrel domain